MNQTNDEPLQQPPKQKRGRKSKKELQAIQEQKDKENANMEMKNASTSENQEINFLFSEKDESHQTINSEKFNTSLTDINDENTVVKPPPKKRGRKPKGGKIVQQQAPVVEEKQERPNVILSLKCTIKDIMQNNQSGYTILNQQNNTNCGLESFNKDEVGYEILDFGEGSNNMNDNNKSTNYFYEKTTNIDTIETQFGNDSKNFNSTINSNTCGNVQTNNCVDYDEDYEYTNKTNEIREIWRKLKQLEHNLHTNNLSDKKSACFWCTCEFDNPPVYVPKHYIKDTYHVYGCFCSPECATAYLMEENIDSSVKFERYHLLNHIYSKIYNYTKNIKPAPNPYYMLSKFYGNLSIQEYRSLLKNERLFLIVDKPLTRVLPELHEDNDDFILNNKVIPSNGYQIKKNAYKKPQTKSNILTEKFGLTAAM